jgi:hypothetical protein
MGEFCRAQVEENRVVVGYSYKIVFKESDQNKVM